jgi:hypothetical protein
MNDIERLTATLEEARLAGVAAYETFKAKVCDGDGVIKDSCGYATALVYKPSFHFREALKKLGKVDKWHGGKWSIRSDIHVPDQSITAHEEAIKGFLAVMEEAY